MSNDSKRPAFAKGVSPRLTFRFPKLSEPDFGNAKFPKPDGEYSVSGIARADDPAIKTFIAKLQPEYEKAREAAEEAFSKLKVDARKKLGKVTMNDLFTTVYDNETEEPTGEIIFKFAMPAGGTFKKGPKAGKKWTAKPDIYDAKGQPMTKVPEIWGGTVGKISFEMSPYFIPGTGAGGLKLRLRGVQIIDLVQGGQRTAKGHGFGEEDGYVHEESGFADESEGEEETSAATPSDNEDF